MPVFILRHIPEISLCLVGQILESIYKIFQRCSLQRHWLAILGLLPLVVPGADRPVTSDNEDASTVAGQHCYDSPCIGRCLIGAECLWTDEVADCVAEIESAVCDGLLGLAGGVGLREGYCGCVWAVEPLASELRGSHRGFMCLPPVAVHEIQPDRLSGFVAPR
jgi:hypothetical protein